METGEGLRDFGEGYPFPTGRGGCHITVGVRSETDLDPPTPSCFEFELAEPEAKTPLPTA